MLGQKLVEDLPAPFPRYAASLAAVGFFDPEPLLEQKLTTLYARQVAGFYDPAEKKFFIVPERTAETAAGAARSWASRRRPCSRTRFWLTS